MAYAEALTSLYRRASSNFKLGLNAMVPLCDALQNPQAALPYVVVAGTNGKGSTASLLAAILSASGKKTGLFTSPHLLHFTERIRINGEPLAPAAMASLLAPIYHAEASLGLRASFFEVATLLALLAFRQAKVDIAVLEVGLGGRLDATQVAERILSIITPIDLDHQAYLGSTLQAIAREKAAIIKPLTPVVVAPQQPAAMGVIQEAAESAAAPLTCSVPADTLPPPWPAFQRLNAGTAHSAARLLGCSSTAIDQATLAFTWPGRYQWIEGAPPILLDGAHNPAGMQALCAAIRQDSRCQGRRTVAIFSALQDKDAPGMLRPLQHCTTEIFLCGVESTRSRGLDDMADLLPGAPRFRCLQQALPVARRAAGPAGLVLVAGSLFLVADTLHEVLGLPRDPCSDG